MWYVEVIFRRISIQQRKFQLNSLVGKSLKSGIFIRGFVVRALDQRSFLFKYKFSSLWSKKRVVVVEKWQPIKLPIPFNSRKSATALLKKLPRQISSNSLFIRPPHSVGSSHFWFHCCTASLYSVRSCYSFRVSPIYTDLYLRHGSMCDFACLPSL